MTKTKGKRKATPKKTRSAMRRAGGSDLLNLARRMDPTVRQTASIAVWASTGKDIIQELLLPETNPEANLSPAERWDYIVRNERYLRDTGRVDADLAFFIIAVIHERQYDDQCETDAELDRIDREIIAIGKQHGVEWEDDVLQGKMSPDWPEDIDPPAQVEKLMDDYDRRCDAIHAEIFQRYGEDEMADLYLHNQDEYIRRFKRGQDLPPDLKKRESPHLDK